MTKIHSKIHIYSLEKGSFSLTLWPKRHKPVSHIKARPCSQVLTDKILIHLYLDYNSHLPLLGGRRTNIGSISSKMKETC
ncbi:hypothetical protein FKM82_021872 [Ascaphus truei]